MHRLLALSSLVFAASCSPPPAPQPPRCATDATGTVEIISTGLPPGVMADIHLTGLTAETVTSSRSLRVASGEWIVTADRTTAPDPFVRTVYSPTVAPARFCLVGGGTQEVTVTWAPVATSNRLWVTNSNAAGQFIGFRSDSLATTATVRADIVARGGFGTDVAFDRDGNAWVPGGTTADAALQRFPASRFATSGAVEPDLEIAIGGTPCQPLVAGLAFDRVGNLYMSSPCRDSVVRIDAAALLATASAVPSLTIDVPDPGGLAFDRSGNLWVASKFNNRIWRFDASQLATRVATAPIFEIGAYASSSPAERALLTPNWIAFDARGALWANDFGRNIFYRFDGASLGATAMSDLQPQVRITLGVAALLEGFAFDGEGGLWCAGVGGTIVRLAPAQLDVSTEVGNATMPATVLTSSDIGSASTPAFYPAPAGLPLFHSLP